MPPAARVDNRLRFSHRLTIVFFIVMTNRFHCPCAIVGFYLRVARSTPASVPPNPIVGGEWSSTCFVAAATQRNIISLTPPSHLHSSNHLKIAVLLFRSRSFCPDGVLCWPSLSRIQSLGCPVSDRRSRRRDRRRCERLKGAFIPFFRARFPSRLRWCLQSSIRSF